MQPTSRSFIFSLAGAAAMGLVPATVAHGGDMDMAMGDEKMSAPEHHTENPGYPPTYFAYPEHRGLIYTHIALMIVSWVFMLPVAVMLSLARSRYTLAVQCAFLTVNAVGVLVSVMYNANTPDLYPNNAHHKLGWAVTWIVGAQVLVGLLSRTAAALRARRAHREQAGERQAFMPISTEAMDKHQRMYRRLSNDSGQGTEPNTESLRSHSVSTNEDETSIPLHDDEKETRGGHDEGDDLEEVDLAALPRRVGRGGGRLHSLVQKAAGVFSTRAWRFVMFGYNVVDRVILILGFATFALGIATFGRFFEGHQIFTGLAHWIKGGIFFWLGILTLGRWAGCFGELGWAWNVRPRVPGQRWRPSAEFAESALIFMYGCTNIFLEHLGNWGKEYSPEDLEHISITVLFIGGGLCGMLVESTRIRDLLNTTVTETAHKYPEPAYRDQEENGTLQPPRQYEFSVNPIPALVILLLGIMMSSHTQETMISSMIHKQWGNMLTGASFARGFSYVLTYLKPPRSVLPSRPPTELLASFGLIAGGIIFMASSGDTVDGMIHYNLDAMFLYTVTMGFVGLLMAWVILVIALKGWAVRKEAGRPAGSYRTAA